MRKAELAVPSEVMAEFAHELTQRDLDNKIVGVDEDDDILIEIFYEKEQEKIVDQLETILEDLREQVEEDDEEEAH